MRIEQPFSNREITAMFETIKAMLESHTEVHKNIMDTVGVVIACKKLDMVVPLFEIRNSIL